MCMAGSMGFTCACLCVSLPPFPIYGAVLHRLRPHLVEHWLSDACHGLEVCRGPAGVPVSGGGWERGSKVPQHRYPFCALLPYQRA